MVTGNEVLISINGNANEGLEKSWWVHLIKKPQYSEGGEKEGTYICD